MRSCAVDMKAVNRAEVVVPGENGEAHVLSGAIVSIDF